MSDATNPQCEEAMDYTAVAAVTGGQIIQLPDGRAGVVPTDLAAAQEGSAAVEGIFTVTKTASIVILDGGKVYWDYSANKAHYKPVNDLDFYIGTAVGDAASADTTMRVNLNNQPVYNLDLARDSFTSVIAGTAAAGGFGYPRRAGGSTSLVATATNEAQKVDAFGDDGFATGANAIVEMRVSVVDGDAAGAADFNVGIASATHATDADSIAKHLFLHIDGNSTNINFQSKDGTTTVAATDSTIDYVASTAFEVWMDMRDPADVQIYVNGALVLGSTVFDVSASASTWFLLAHLEKTSSTDTFNGKVDWLRARMSNE